MTERFDIKLPVLYGDVTVPIRLEQGITVFIGPNGSGKTQMLKALKFELLRQGKKVRYLSSNRIGTMEQYRSKTNQYNYNADNYNVGDLEMQRSRLEVETANGDFMSMDAERDLYVKVAARLSVLFNRQVYLRWDAGNLKVVFEKVGTNKEYSVVAEASGLINLISILAAIYETKVSYLLIDEPEVSLHPQLQSYLLCEIKSACERTGKTIVLSTHSVDMIDIASPKELCNLVFFEEGKCPSQIGEDEDILKNRKLGEFLLRLNQTYKAGFFARRILLLEGVSDLLLCKCLCAKLQINIGAAGAQVIPIDGKGQFPTVIKLFRLIGKEVCVLTDLDGFTDSFDVINLFDQLPLSVSIANEGGVAALSEVSRGIKNSLGELIKRHDGVISSHYSNHPYWIKEGQMDEDRAELVRRRAVVGTMFIKGKDGVASWPDGVEWKSLWVRIHSLFDKYAQVGCFILRKGAIESYYRHVENTEYDDKPSKAIEEASGISGERDEDVRSWYADIVRAIEHIAICEKIDESNAVRKELLSEIAVAINELQSKGESVTTMDLLSAIKNVKGSASPIFKYSIVNNEGRLGIEVSLKTTYLDVQGFPFVVYIDDNVNAVVSTSVKSA